MVERVERKSMLIRESGRSTDFISPSFGHGCLYNCTYCYMKRHKPQGLSIATNTDTILDSLQKHILNIGIKKVSNQTHDKFWTYDISCNEDFALHMKYHEVEKIFKFFNFSSTAFASFATKYVNKDLLNYNPRNIHGESKIRVRMSLMPEKFRQQLEPNTTPILERIRFINVLQEAGYEVHINFSPVIVVPGALKLYEQLFKLVDLNVTKYKSDVKAEVIFLTHNETKHYDNLINKLPGEDLLWNPSIQEPKKSQYGGKNIRYKWKLKKELIREFTRLHDEIIPWNKIRYIF